MPTLRTGADGFVAPAVVSRANAVTPCEPYNALDIYYVRSDGVVERQQTPH